MLGRTNSISEWRCKLSSFGQLMKFGGHVARQARCTLKIRVMHQLALSISRNYLFSVSSSCPTLRCGGARGNKATVNFTPHFVLEPCDPRFKWPKAFLYGFFCLSLKYPATHHRHVKLLCLYRRTHSAHSFLFCCWHCIQTDRVVRRRVLLWWVLCAVNLRPNSWTRQVSLQSLASSSRL